MMQGLYILVAYQPPIWPPEHVYESDWLGWEPTIIIFIYY